MQKKTAHTNNVGFSSLHELKIGYILINSLSEHFFLSKKLTQSRMILYLRQIAF